MAPQQFPLVKHCHGKSRVRVGRVWRLPNGTHLFSELSCEVLLESPMEKAFTAGDNSGMTATDTVKNNIYKVAKAQSKPVSADAFAVALAEHFVRTYPLVTAAEVTVEQKQWERTAVDGQAHDHGFVLRSPETRLGFALARRGAATSAGGGVRDWSVLKTTQSGYEGFLKDAMTALPETRERMLATSVTAVWRYSSVGIATGAVDPYGKMMTAMHAAFFGPSKGGVYSPGVQATLYDMGCAALSAEPGVETISLRAPNIHFLPVLPAGIPFDNDVYVATSEPHGTIQATVARKVQPGMSSSTVQVIARL